MRDFAKAAETADHGPSTLRRYADDQALAVLINALRLNDEQNAIAQGEPKLNPTIVSATPEKVVIEDCTDTSSVLLYNRKTGKPINDEPGGLRRIDATISRKEIGWKATKIRIWQVGSC
ncbi:hypothetical protein ACIBH1_06800 [Nonomuraea sp. NPDC050663]|uniref:hypothetical protein n=1 Tax=Nonomuraea sp. NPDC050663 TaxID=3364370 RepID=UPI003795076E